MSSRASTERALRVDVGAFRAVAFQRWRDLLFLHWPLRPETVRPLVPKPLALDLLDGCAWVTLIPFSIPAAWPAGAPSLSLSMLETNLRTYVRGPDGEAGIYFWSLESSSWLASAGARLAYGLPYFPAAMRRRRVGVQTTYTSRRRVGSRAALAAVWSVGESRGIARRRTPEHFLLERYALYAMRRGTLVRARVRHRHYALTDVRLESCRQTLLEAAGLGAVGDPAFHHHSPGVDVALSLPRPVRA